MKKLIFPVVALVSMSFTKTSHVSTQIEEAPGTLLTNEIKGSKKFTEFKVIRSTICWDAFKETIHAKSRKDDIDDDKDTDTDDKTVDQNTGTQPYKIIRLITKYSS